MTLIIEYITEGKERGYNFTSPTRSYSEDVIKTIWKNAMPRGQGWGAYIGAESRKCFGLSDGRIALSHMVVTDAQDEIGRRGIRRTVIDVVTPSEYPRVLKTMLDLIPVSIQRDADHHLRQWEQNRAFPSNQIRRAKQLIFAHLYSTYVDWRVVEAVMLKIALAPPSQLRFLHQPFSFTTMALDNREESTLVGMPYDKTGNAGNAPVMRVI
jgi:hypothetical protein